MVDLLIANATALIHEGKSRYRIIRNQTIVRADDPVVKGREKLFKPLTVHYLGNREGGSVATGVVEATTANPGEKRQLSSILSRPQRAESEPDQGDVREWAKGQGIEVSDRGRLPAGVVEQYKRHKASGGDPGSAESRE